MILPANSSVRIFCLGKDFWDDVSLGFGSTIAAVGQGMLPHKLTDGKGAAFSDFEAGSPTVDFELTLQSLIKLAIFFVLLCFF